MDRQRDYALGLGILVVCVNVVLMLVKIGVGIIGNSYALVADGIESAGDIFTSLITWAGFQLSLRPADESHPFGYGRVETLAGLFSGAALFGAAGLIAWQAIGEIRTPHHGPAWYTLPVLLGVVAFKEGLFRKIKGLATKLESPALEGDAWHHRSDAITSGAAALGIAIALIGGPRFAIADDWAALAACPVILLNGVRIIRRAMHEALDGRVGEEKVAEIRKFAATVDGVAGIEKCLLRKSGVGYFVELHVEVDGHLSVAEGHEIGHRVKDHILADDDRVLDVTVHLEPAGQRGGLPDSQEM
jgi:cation diffusion facilitator family transporter